MPPDMIHQRHMPLDLIHQGHMPLMPLDLLFKFQNIIKKIQELCKHYGMEKLSL